MLIVRFNNYQGATFFTAANSAVGNLYATFADIDNYFGLHRENAALHAHNKELLDEIALLRTQVDELKSQEALYDDSIVKSISSGYKFHTAKVISGSNNSVDKYYVINKGRRDSIKSEMGIFNSQGVVGIIYHSSERYSLVLPLLNSRSRTSCKVIGDEASSILQWDGNDTRYSHLVDLPRHTRITEGDTVVTSGHSEIFPAGITVGTIDGVESTADGMFYRARVKLSTNFASLTSVFIVGNKGHKELKELMNKIPE